MISIDIIETANIAMLLKAMLGHVPDDLLRNLTTDQSGIRSRYQSRPPCRTAT